MSTLSVISDVQTQIVEARTFAQQGSSLLETQGAGTIPPCRLPGWTEVLREGLGHETHLLVAHDHSRLVSYLPLALVRSRLFGRFLVGLPYLNSGGIVGEHDQAAVSLIDRAVQLADELDVRYLELRHERRYEHAALAHEVTSKVHMRLALPNNADALWTQLKAKVRNQVRKGRENRLTVEWGGENLLAAFYDVFSRNMRDLGTPVYGKGFFRAMVKYLSGQAEFCVVQQGARPVAAALLVHGQGVTEVPSASSLRQFSSTNANMLMYWHLLERAIQRGQHTFDFGRSTIDSNTFRFKKQWGAEPHPAVWQYYVRRGTVGDMRPESSRYRHFIRVWQRLPVGLTRLVGPAIVRGIP
ncbi:MAG TPA: FemAB family XrtA/PEP-CTERM system-associated protein [Pirellulales bacterium]|nr:FemAB family XrtA/PEP-CTERM system-associated protein [Pirellulales bacterium]